MVKRVVFGFAVFVALVAGGTALANAAPVRSSAHPMGLVWGGSGGRLAPRPAQTFGRVAQPMINVFFPGQYESPVNRYDWSHYLGWLIRETD